MTIKNISGIGQVFSLSSRAAVYIADGEVSHIEDSWEHENSVVEYVSRGLLSIVKGTSNSTLIQSSDTPGSIKITASGTPADGDKVTVNGVVFEFDSNSAVTGNNIPVTIGGSATVALNNFITAVTANAKFAGYVRGGVVGAGGSVVVAYIILPSSVKSSGVVVSKSSTNITSVGVEEASIGEAFRNFIEERTIDTTPDDLYFITDLTDIVDVTVSVRTSAGVKVAYDGVVRWDGGVITLDASGDNDISATNVVVVKALGH